MTVIPWDSRSSINLLLSEIPNLVGIVTIVKLVLSESPSRPSRNASVGVHGYALVFSIASRQSFERIAPINDALLNALGDAQDVPRVLVGSMQDLTHQRQVSTQDAQTLAESMRIPYLECSSKTGENVAEVFHTLMKEIERDEGLLNENEENGCSIL